eukprot:9476896-Pyramimonas_sp.AAC.1
MACASSTRPTAGRWPTTSRSRRLASRRATATPARSGRGGVGTLNGGATCDWGSKLESRAARARRPTTQPRRNARHTRDGGRTGADFRRPTLRTEAPGKRLLQTCA